MNDGACILHRPCTVQVSFAETVTECFRSQGMEILIETSHLGAPLGNERLRANNQNVFQFLARLEFFENQTSFNCLAHADFIRDQQARAVRPQKSQQRLELKRDEFDTCGVECVEIVGERVSQTTSREAGTEFVSRN